jgi:uncharacterized RDD family membrane protein YckC
VAYEIDKLILFIFGAATGKVFFDRLAQLGLWGQLAGFCVAVIYFASFDSKIGNGQTFGKRWLKVRVVDAKGDTISFAKSLLRSVIFLAPVFLFGLNLPETQTSWIVYVYVFVIILGVSCSTLFFIAFNRQARQGLHDLAAGSYVGNADDVGFVEGSPISKAQWVTIGSLLFIALVVAGIGCSKLEMMPPLPQMRNDAILIEQMGGIQRAQLSDRLLHDAIGGGAKKNLNVSITLRSKSVNQEAFADEVARVILQNDQHAQNYDQLSIRLNDGYDIGIAAHWNHQEFTRAPADWSQRVFAVSQEQR